MAVRRLGRPLPAIIPRTRARLLAGFLALHLAAVLLTLLDTLGWSKLAGGDWLWHLNAHIEEGAADRYSGVLFGVVALLAAAQAVRPSVPRRGPRWLWRSGWLSAALFIALVAFEELHRQLDPAAVVASMFRSPEVWDRAPWMVAALSFAAIPALAALWVLVTAQHGHPARLLVTILALALALMALALDAASANADFLRVLVDLLDFPLESRVLYPVFEEGTELMAAATLAVILIEMRAGRTDTVPVTSGSCRRHAVALAATIGVLAVGMLAPLTHRVPKSHDWGIAVPSFYTGPLTLVEQPFQANQDNLRRIDVWAYVDGGAPGETAEIFARLTPTEGTTGPVRESRATVDGTRFSDATAAFHFEPIPDSRGHRYTLAIGVLGGPTPYVFLGLTDGATIPEGAAVVSGAPTRHEDDLAMRTVGNGRFVERMFSQDQRNWKLTGEAGLVIFLWVFLVVATWAGLSGPRPRFWRGFVAPTVFTSALIMVGFLSVTSTLLLILTPTRFL